MSKKEEKKEAIVKPLSIEIKEVKEEIRDIINTHTLTAVNIEEIGYWLAEEGRKIIQLQEQQYYESLEEKEGETEDGISK